MTDIPIEQLCSAYLLLGIFIGWLAEGVAIGLAALGNLVFKWRNNLKEGASK